MAKVSVLKNPKRVTIHIEGDIHAAAQIRARELEIGGGVSEYFSRLVVQDHKCKGYDLKHTSRHLPKPARRAA